ncbi:MAG TPA: hypothetical protein VHX52_05295 [Steroidobacteraceae bacterium]|jgi:hypothetical protein|nr:hypothetical protein [Steroidobacteraceae bacterium]
MAASLFETANLWWRVQYGRHGRYTTATVTGMPHAVARPVIFGQPIETGRHEQFTDADSDQDTLLARIRAEIERRDGSIKKGEPDDSRTDGQRGIDRTH